MVRRGRKCIKNENAVEKRGKAEEGMGKKPQRKGLVLQAVQKIDSEVKKSNVKKDSEGNSIHQKGNGKIWEKKEARE